MIWELKFVTMSMENLPFKIRIKKRNLCYIAKSKNANILYKKELKEGDLLFWIRLKMMNLRYVTKSKIGTWLFKANTMKGKSNI